MKRLMRSVQAVTLISFSLIFLQACAQPVHHQNVASAYQTSGILASPKPYTRTIFSSENF